MKIHIRLIIVAIIFVPLMFLIPASLAQEGACGSVLEYELTAGQSIDVGSVSIWNDETTVYVELSTTGDWVLLESHVHVGDSLADVPSTDSGTPIPGQFAYSHTYNNNQGYTYSITPDSFDAGSQLIIVVHASVALPGSAGSAAQQETAFGGGQRGDGARWWFYITYTVQSCDETQETTDNEGCTPGYWRQENHYADWVAFDPDDLYQDVFEVEPEEDGITLGEAVQARGGDEDALLRHSTAALLNSFNRDVDYPYSAAQVFQMTRFAFNTGNYEAIKDVLDEANNLGCPLGRRGSRNNRSEVNDRGNRNASSEDNPRGNGRGNNSDDDDSSVRGNGNGRGNTNSGNDARGNNGRSGNNGRGNNATDDEDTTDTSSP